MENPQSEEKKKEYEQYVNQVTPKQNLPVNMLKAFVVGGLICVLGQFIINAAMNQGVTKEDAGAWCSLILVFLSALFTGLNLYQRLVTFGGAGALVPITGFANSVVSPAMEFKSEGFIMGTGASIFKVAGPVILYGTTAASLYGLIYFIVEKVINK